MEAAADAAANAKIGFPLYDHVESAAREACDEKTLAG